VGRPAIEQWFKNVQAHRCRRLTQQVLLADALGVGQQQPGFQSRIVDASLL